LQVVFRLFATLSTSTAYSSYYGWATSSTGASVAVPGIGIGSQAGQYVTLPFFASDRVPGTDSLTGQLDPDNSTPFPPIDYAPNPEPAPGSSYEIYFGCWLDINERAEGYLPLSVPPAQYGPFETAGGGYAPGVTGLQSPWGWISGQHCCVVAEIHFPGVSIPYLETPAQSPFLAQRNLAWIPTTGGQ
jgi:hypothetical protein